MDGVLKDGRVGQLWMCKKEGGHVLGLHVRVNEGGLKLDKLLVFRNATLEDCLNKAVVLGRVEAMEEIECDICGSKRTWFIGEAALERFLERRKSRVEKEKA